MTVTFQLVVSQGISIILFHMVFATKRRELPWLSHTSRQSASKVQFAWVLSPGVFIRSGLKPVHLSFLYLQNKKRLLQGGLVDFGIRGESCNGQA